MTLTGKVVSKSITANGVFARISLGWPKGAMMRFFDVPDQENFEIGQRVQILLAPEIRLDPKMLEELYDALRDAEQKTTGCMFHSSPEPTISETLQAELEPLEWKEAGSFVKDKDGNWPVVVGEFNESLIVEQVARELGAGVGSDKPILEQYNELIGVAPIVVDETGDASFDIKNIPLPEPTPENMTERSDSPGLGDRR